MDNIHKKIKCKLCNIYFKKLLTYVIVCNIIQITKGGNYIVEQNKPKRKTFTSNEVKLKYNKKTYQQYCIKFRKVEDVDYINAIETEKSKGYTTSEAFKRLIKINPKEK